MKINPSKILAASILVIGLERLSHFSVKSAAPMMLIDRGIPVDRALALNDLLPAALLLALPVGLGLGARRTALAALIFSAVGALLGLVLPVGRLDFALGLMVFGGELLEPAFYLWAAQNCARSGVSAAFRWSTWLTLVIAATIVGNVAAFIGTIVGGSMSEMVWAGAIACSLAAFVVVATSTVEVQESTPPAAEAKGTTTAILGVLLLMVGAAPALLLRPSIPTLAQALAQPASSSGQLLGAATIAIVEIVLLIVFLILAQQKKTSPATATKLLGTGLLFCAAAGGAALLGGKAALLAEPLLVPLSLAGVAVIARFAAIGQWRTAYFSVICWLSAGPAMAVLAAAFPMLKRPWAQVVLAGLCLIGGAFVLRFRRPLDGLLDVGSAFGGLQADKAREI